jgi:hypothetical protein
LSESPKESVALPKCKPKPEGAAPPIDRALLRAVVRQQLSELAARFVYRLVHSYKSWNDAHSEILVEEFRRQSRNAG